MFLSPFARFLLIFALSLLFLMVLGAATRLTGSGLSMTSWDLLGNLPPWDITSWEEVFASYRLSPEGRGFNKDLSLSDFKSIFWWEYAHRMAGRAFGILLLMSLLWFFARGILTRSQGFFLIFLFFLVVLQGFLGWIMVKSGLRSVARVSPYLLASHLFLALFLLSLISHRLLFELGSLWRRVSVPIFIWTSCFFMLFLSFVTFISGAFVAGLRGGRIHNDWPLMSGSFFPSDYWILDSFILNSLWSPAASQFHHRILGLVLFFGSIFLYTAIRRHRFIYGELSLHADLVIMLPILQIFLGIMTLRLEVPVFLGVLHQLCGILLFLSFFLLIFRLRVERVS